MILLLRNHFYGMKKKKMRKILKIGFDTAITTSSIDVHHDLPSRVGLTLTKTLSVTLNLTSSIDIPHDLPTRLGLGLRFVLGLT